MLMTGSSSDSDLQNCRPAFHCETLSWSSQILLSVAYKVEATIPSRQTIKSRSLSRLLTNSRRITLHDDLSVLPPRRCTTNTKENPTRSRALLTHQESFSASCIDKEYEILCCSLCVAFIQSLVVQKPVAFNRQHPPCLSTRKAWQSTLWRLVFYSMTGGKLQPENINVEMQDMQMAFSCSCRDRYQTPVTTVRQRPD